MVPAATERTAGFEPATFALARQHSTTELRPRNYDSNYTHVTEEAEGFEPSAPVREHDLSRVAV